MRRIIRKTKEGYNNRNLVASRINLSSKFRKIEGHYRLKKRLAERKKEYKAYK